MAWDPQQKKLILCFPGLTKPGMHRYHVSISNVSRLISHVSIPLRGFPPSRPFMFSSCSAIRTIVCRRLRLLAGIFVRWNINYYLGRRLGAPSGHRQTTSTSILSCQPSFVQGETGRDRERQREEKAKLVPWRFYLC